MGLGVAAAAAADVAASLPPGLRSRSLPASGALLPERPLLLPTRAPRPSSFETCPNDPDGVKAVKPAFLEGEGTCDSKQDFKQLKSFSRDVDRVLEEPLKRVENQRKEFERRACDYQFSQIQDQSQYLTDTYGPTGPMVPGGSYLYELRGWSDAVHSLYKACSKSQSCTNLLGFLQKNPEVDHYGEGFHGRAGSRLYNELREACQVGKTRSPVPNDQPVWCDDLTGLCEQKSCRQWWRSAHGGRPDPKPWVDDREEYDDLRDACAWTTEDRYQPGEIDAYQHSLVHEQKLRRDQYCTPRWIEGYCSSTEKKKRYAECVLNTGQRCTNGRVIPGSDLDATAGWLEPLKEPPVEFSLMPPLIPWLLAQAAQPPAPSPPAPCKRASPGAREFL